MKKSYFSKNGIIFTYKNNATHSFIKSKRAKKPHFFSQSLQFSEDVRLDELLSNNERMLLADIINLVKKKGYCYATNEYLSKIHHVSTRTISRWLRKLRELAYISIEIIKTDKKQIVERRIRIIDEYDKKSISDNGIIIRCFNKPPYRQNCRNNIILSKITSSNSKNGTILDINAREKNNSVTDSKNFDWLTGVGFDPLG